MTVAAIQQLTDEMGEEVVAASKYVTRLCERIEEGLVKGTVQVDTAKTISMIRQHDELAGQISLHLQRGAIQ
ncbi:hypothetical protein [Sphingomonas sp. Leaf412]|uniref:hypothetical protein n=1 Tax=Sphingomonas sp. Leaf412 TaxID=1736370 RepID=UPI0012E3F255|nr:hypothetical protein [Sphingomonas sp. Leaf412]